jgi:hypothetical protein
MRTKKRIVMTAVMLALGGAACESTSSEPAKTTAPPTSSEGAGPPRLGDKVAAAVAEPVSVRLTVKVNKNGAAEVVDAVELPGIIRQEKDMNRDFVYEARDGRGVVAVQALDLDFERRPIGGGEHGEHIAADEQLVHVDLPGVSLERARGVSLRLSKVNARHQEKLASVESFARLSRQGTLVPFAELRPSTMDTAVVRQGRRAVRAPSVQLEQ